MFGCLTFVGHGCWGKVALQDRQMASGQDHSLTAELHQCFDMVDGLLRLRPRRLFSLQPSSSPRFTIASDAAQEQPGQGSAGSLVVLPSGSRIAIVLTEVDKLFPLWGDQPAKIAQLELYILHGLARLCCSVFDSWS